MTPRTVPPAPADAATDATGAAADAGRRPPLAGRLGAWCARHAWRVVAAWLVVLAAAAVLFPRFSDGLTGASLTVNGSESERAERLLASEFGTSVTEDVVAVFHSETLTAADEPFRQAVARGAAALADEPEVAHVRDPYATPGQIAEDGHTALLVAGLTGDAASRQEAAPRLQEALDTAATGDVEALLTGSSPLGAAVVAQQDADLARAEAIALPVALVVLALAFGTLVAAGLPLLLGMVTVLTSFGALGAVSGLASFDVFTQAVVAMIGLALGIDYSLFVVTRQREELAAHPDRPIAETVGATMATAGKAVLFSGGTVAISIAGLLLVRAPVFRNIALGVMTAVVVMLAVAVTLLPAVLALLGTRLNRLPLPWLRSSVARPEPERSLWGRWSRVVMRRPVVVGGVAAVALAAAALPATEMRLGFHLGAEAVADEPAGRGYALVAEEFAPGTATPLRLVASEDGGLSTASLRALDTLAQRLAADDRVAAVTSGTDVLREHAGGVDEAALNAVLAADAEAVAGLFGPEGNAAALTVVPRVAPDSAGATDLVEWIRGTAVPEAVTEAGAGDLSVAVGGLTAATADLSAEVSRATPVVLAAVLGLSFVLLLLAFRSLLLPLKAITMNLIAVGAAFGLLTWVFQDGAGEGALDFTSAGFIQAYLPLLAFVALFGLSMDYEVFLLSRMKEEWGRSRDNASAVTSGLVHSAKVITAAAAIMVVVFAAFMITRVLEIKQIGFAFAVAVLVDATVIRVMLVPAFMRLAGRANWWLPGWLDRALPRVDLTESAPAPPREHAAAPR